MSQQCLGPTRCGHYNEVILLKRWLLSEVSLCNEWMKSFAFLQSLGIKSFA